MPRKGEVKRRDVLPDPKFHDRLVTKFMNTMMHDGKKSLAERILYGALDLVAERAEGGPARRLQARARQREAAGRGALAPRRRRHLPGARSRSARSAASSLGDALARAARPRPPREVDGASGSPASCSTPPTTAAARSRRRKTRTGWRRPTRPSPTTAGSASRARADVMPRHRPPRAHPQHRHHGPHRCRQDHDDRAHPLLHRHQLQDRRGPRGHRRRWTGWCRSRSAASPSPPPRPPASGATTASTSSTRPATSTSPSRSSARCACSTARSRVFCSRRRRRAAVRDRLAPGRPVRRPAHRVRQQDGPHRRRLRPRRRSMMRDRLAREPGRRSSCRSAPRRRFRGVIDLVTHEGDRLGRREPRRAATARTRSPPT